MRESGVVACDMGFWVWEFAGKGAGGVDGESKEKLLQTRERFERVPCETSNKL